MIFSSVLGNFSTPTHVCTGLLPDSQWRCGGVGENVSGGSPGAGGNVRGAGAAESREKDGNSQGELHFIEFDHELATSVVGIVLGAYCRRAKKTEATGHSKKRCLSGVVVGYSSKWGRCGVCGEANLE